MSTESLITELRRICEALSGEVASPSKLSGLLGEVIRDHGRGIDIAPATPLWSEVRLDRAPEGDEAAHVVLVPATTPLPTVAEFQSAFGTYLESVKTHPFDQPRITFVIRQAGRPRDNRIIARVDPGRGPTEAGVIVSLVVTRDPKFEPLEKSDDLKRFISSVDAADTTRSFDIEALERLGAEEQEQAYEFLLARMNGRADPRIPDALARIGRQEAIAPLKRAWDRYPDAAMREAISNALRKMDA